LFRWPFACFHIGMRPLAQTNLAKPAAALSAPRLVAALVCLFAATGVVVTMCGCSQSGGTTTTMPPLQIQVTVSPLSGMVLLGNTQTFLASVTNTANTGVTWSVNGVTGGSAASGTISAAGVYTAPGDLPSPANVQVTATSAADPTKSASATIAITSDIVVIVTPNIANVELGAVQPFGGSITSAGHPDTSLRWSLSGPECPNQCGAIDANGNFTAPQILPSPASITLTAQSVADPSKTTTAAVTVTSNFTLTLSAPASVPTNGTAAIVATFVPVPGSNPSQVLNWAVTGPGCSGSACGTLSTITSQSTGASKSTNSATYTAPTAAPTPDNVTISVTPQADPSKRARATLTVAPGVEVSITPGTATLAANHRVTLTPQVNGSANPNVLWNVNGVSGGNAAFGQICITGSSPCQSVLTATPSPVDYLAPGAIPTPDPVTVQAVSDADATKSATAEITVINHVLVSVLPASVTLAPLAVQHFSATVLGTSNQSVVWQISGAACSAGGGVCGIVDTSGNYSAPAATPSPDSLQVLAVSQDDSTQSGAASVTISTGANVFALHPASVYAGAAQGFTLQVDGSGFVLPAGSSTGSTLLIAGSARTTTCSSANECIAPVTASDVSVTGSVSIQMQNPGGTQSNVVELVVVAPNSSDASVPLTSEAPIVTGQNIVVVDPTTAGVSTADDDVDLDVAAMGAFSTATNSCTLAGNPVTLQRPTSGSTTADLCLFSESGLDASMTVSISGPGDMTVLSEQPAGLGILHVTLQLPANAFPGPRTIFIQTTNLDETAASGAVEIE